MAMPHLDSTQIDTPGQKLAAQLLQAGPVGTLVDLRHDELP